MAIPLVYNLRSLRARWASTVVAVVGIAGTVSVFVAMLSLGVGLVAGFLPALSAARLRVVDALRRV